MRPARYAGRRVRHLVEEKQTHYLAVLKRNHATLFEEVRALPWARVPLGHKTRDVSRGGLEIHRRKIVHLRRGTAEGRKPS